MISVADMLLVENRMMPRGLELVWRKVKSRFLDTTNILFSLRKVTFLQ